MSEGSSVREVDVLVVGGGPVGLMAALLLSRLKFSVLVAERRVTRSSAPKAHVINPRSLEILAAAGLPIDEMRRRATSSADDGRARFVSRLTGSEVGSVPFEKYDDIEVFSPHPRINLMQPLLEDFLTEQLADAQRVRVERGLTWLSATSEQNGVTSVLRSRADTEVVHSSYVLAADGANSGVRDFLGIGMHGLDSVQPCVAITIQVDLRDVVRDRPAMLYAALRARVPGIFLAYDIDSTWSYYLLGVSTAPSEDECREIIRDAIGTPVDFEIRLISPWAMTAQVADSYRAGRFFLAGDAAHRFPPTGGLGLNTGIQDVHNLAWKLRAVESGWATSDLLNTYESERLPVADANTAQSLQNAQSLVDLLSLPEDADEAVIDAAVLANYTGFNGIGLQLGYTYGEHTSSPDVSVFIPRGASGDRMPHAWLHGASGTQTSTLDLLSLGHYSLLTYNPDSWNLREIDYICVVDMDGLAVPEEWEALVGISRSRALLVRPDGHIAGVADDGDAMTLHSLLPGRVLARRREDCVKEICVDIQSVSAGPDITRSSS